MDHVVVPEGARRDDIFDRIPCHLSVPEIEEDADDVDMPSEELLQIAANSLDAPVELLKFLQKALFFIPLKRAYIFVGLQDEYRADRYVSEDQFGMRLDTCALRSHLDLLVS